MAAIDLRQVAERNGLMSTIELSRAQRRQMQKLADRVDRATQSDRRFFERFPFRQHRVRVASQAEIEQNTILLGAEDMALPAGRQHFVAVKNVATGFRLRLTVVGPRDADTDLSEEDARDIYEVVNNDKAREIEASMLKAAGARQ